MKEPTTTGVSVEYTNAEPTFITVNTRRWSSEFSYDQTYKFKMVGSTAEFTRVSGDGDSYSVASNKETRREAKKTVSELPFVQAVVMFE